MSNDGAQDLCLCLALGLPVIDVGMFWDVKRRALRSILTLSAVCSLSSLLVCPLGHLDVSLFACGSYWNPQQRFLLKTQSVGQLINRKNFYYEFHNFWKLRQFTLNSFGFVFTSNITASSPPSLWLVFESVKSVQGLGVTTIMKASLTLKNPEVWAMFSFSELLQL